MDIFNITDASTMGDRLLLGATTLLLGIVVVFSILALIFFTVKLLQLLFHKKSTAKTPAAVPAPAPALAPVETAAPASNTPDGTVLAVIVAAVAAVTGEAPSSFRVVSFKKK